MSRGENAESPGKIFMGFDVKKKDQKKFGRDSRSPLARSSAPHTAAREGVQAGATPTKRAEGERERVSLIVTSIFLISRQRSYWGERMACGALCFKQISNSLQNGRLFVSIQNAILYKKNPPGTFSAGEEESPGRKR